MAEEFRTPQSANEAILQNMLGAENELREPQSVVEDLLQQIFEQGQGGGSSLPEVTVEDNGDVLAVVEGAWSKAEAPKELPSVTSTDEGKILGVNAQGEWSKQDAPSGLPSTTGVDTLTVPMLLPSGVGWQTVNENINVMTTSPQFYNAFLSAFTTWLTAAATNLGTIAKGSASIQTGMFLGMLVNQIKRGRTPCLQIPMGDYIVRALLTQATETQNQTPEAATGVINTAYSVQGIGNVLLSANVIISDDSVIVYGYAIA